MSDKVQPPGQKNRGMGPWEYLSRIGLAESVLHLGTHILFVLSIVLIASGLRSMYLLAQFDASFGQADLLENLEAAEPAVVLDRSQTASHSNTASAQMVLDGVARRASLHTDVPSRERLQVIQYTSQPGDTLFGIATKFGVSPETILWANSDELRDNPHNLRPGQQLDILPVSGIYHRWSAGDSLKAVADFFHVRPEDIVNFPGNNLSPMLLGNGSGETIETGSMLIIPGGRRDFVSWSAPDIPRDNPSVAKVLGPGACETIGDGAVGSAIFIWPAGSRFLSGYDFNPQVNHAGIDIDGKEGDPVYAADSGVVVYAGGNNWGYGNMVIINHGNGWQTLYAHLSAVYVTCGQGVNQSDVIGTIGMSGQASNLNLHFEMMYNGMLVDPKNYIP